jgi:hypothetical protein
VAEVRAEIEMSWTLTSNSDRITAGRNSRERDRRFRSAWRKASCRGGWVSATRPIKTIGSAEALTTFGLGGVSGGHQPN